MPTYRGSWRLRVIGNDAMYAQRVVIDGSATHVIRGEVGQEKVISGKKWRLRPEYNDDSRWRRSAKISRRPVEGGGRRSGHLILVKDTFTFDDAPNDLVLLLEEVPTEPFTIEDSSGIGSTDPGGGASSRENGGNLLGVTIENTGHEAFGYDRVLGISSAGRARLAEHGVVVQDEWPLAVLRSTGQEVFDGAVSLPPLDVGESTAAYFAVDSSGAIPGTPSVEFEMRWDSSGGRERTSRCSAEITVHRAQGPLPDTTPTYSASPSVSSVRRHREATADE